MSQTDRTHIPPLQNASNDHPDRGSETGSSKIQTPSKRFVFNTWRDTDDHALCTWAMVNEPDRAPFQGRTGVATANWVVVEKIDGRQLVCNRLHDGPCEWPWDVTAS